MIPLRDELIEIDEAMSGQTLAAVVRRCLTGASWSQAKRVILGRHVRVNDELCLDPARRLKLGDAVAVRRRPERLPSAFAEELNIRHLDDHVVVVEKPAGLNTVRHPAELHWKQARRQLAPTLQDRVQWAIAARFRRKLHELPRLRIVHRIDKETSGLVVFGRSAHAERELGRQFRTHQVIRRYLALVPGSFSPRTIRSFLVRDRGDGRRGSTSVPGMGKEAITHVEVAERLPGYTLLSCRLETGRTHQIRIHLAEAGHPVCGDKVYVHRPDGTVLPDPSGCPRLFLHATELGFCHPATGEAMHWSMPLPDDLQSVLIRLRHGDHPDQAVPPRTP
ncbi:MAG: RluA family pseudouridine synthase [Gemmataceae bacterium]|nr:RluA family pseudouridine synthase [Gemmataceae bacterium]